MRPTGSAQDSSLPARLNLSSTNAVSVPLTTPANPTKWTTTLNAATGAFTGGFTLVDDNANTMNRKVTRSVPFSGVLRQPATTQDTLIGDGHYLLPLITGLENPSGEVMFTRP